MHDAFVFRQSSVYQKIALMHMDTKHVATGEYRKTCFKPRLCYDCPPQEMYHFSLIWQPQEIPT